MMWKIKVRTGFISFLKMSCVKVYEFESSAKESDAVILWDEWFANFVADQVNGEALSAN